MAVVTPAQVARFADMFSAMGTEARLRIMQLLMTAEPKGMIVGDLQSEIDIPNSTLSPRQAKKRKSRHRTPRGNLPLVSRQHRRPQSSSRFALRRVLHAQSCGRAKRFSFDFQMRKGTPMSSENIKSIVQEKYGAAAKRAASGQASACCGSPTLNF